MSMGPVIAIRVLVLLCLCFASVRLHAGLAGEATESEVKAAFLYNFSKFIEWPETSFQSPSSPIVIGVVSDPSFAHTLNTIVAGKTVNGRTILVKTLEPASDLTGCHMVYVPGSNPRVAEFVARAPRASILTVGDADEFTRTGGVIRFFLTSGRVRFEINIEAAQRANLRISSKLLAVATLTHSGTRRAGGE